MPLSEFSIIERYFIAPAHPCAREFSASMHVKRDSTQADNLVLGIGDDAALIEPPSGELLAISVDTLIAGRHFPEQTNPGDIGYKSLAVNLSDMAAMGAIPRWITLSLALPEVDEDFLGGFSEQLLTLADQHDVQLIGGDTVRGPLTITVQIIGTVPADGALKRSGARVGDAIFVSGCLGDAAGGLAVILAGEATTDDECYLIERLNRPSPRVDLGLALRGVATAVIDISDGLLADLAHILEQSGVGAVVDSDRIPCSEQLRRTIPDQQQRVQLMVAGGDDYELCFTVPLSRVDEVNKISAELSLPLVQVGTICEGSELLLDGKGIANKGFDHFKGKEHGS